LNENRYVDSESCVQLIGCVLRDQSLLDSDGVYFYTEDDFVSEFHKVVFGAIYNLYIMGTQDIQIKNIVSYLEDRPESKAIFNQSNGVKWLNEVLDSADVVNFDYYYNRVKKMTLLRGYVKVGLDVSWLLDMDNITDFEKRQQQFNYFDSLTLEEVAEKIENRILDIRSRYVDNSVDDGVLLSDGMADLIHSLERRPDVGYPMYGNLVNSITRGMRLGKFYIRSAATGVGKSRTMMADFCNAACPKIWRDGEWRDNGPAMPSMFISTELEIDELQTLAIAFLADVNESNILNNSLGFAERERVVEAIQIFQESPAYIYVVPDFGIKDIENLIKRNIRTRKVRFIFYDYLHSSMKIISDIARASSGMKLREDLILFLLSVKLKEIATTFGVFIMTATQLNQAWKTDDIPDQNLLRGSKAIADKVDVGMILLDVTKDDLERLDNVLNEQNQRVPNVKMSIYKNRRGEYSNCFLWMYADKATARFDGLFLTDYSYELIEINELNIHTHV